ncbi:MAG: hypothetical protein LRY53_07515 [Burkholderiaceae bacterium]|nr:hypothetical protein [Burkholderiaceae bacterium]MCD8565476.1 hypothetical protein [Burkholderiaceae bacterium]
MAHEPVNSLELDPYIATQYPLASTGDQRLKEMLAWALLSPSPHNTQPWRWSVQNGVVRLYADYSRRLAVCDPDARELIIGCGSSLEHYLLRVGLDGDPVRVDLLPDASQPELLAQVVVGQGEPYARCPDLVDAMQLRRTNRTAYHGDPITRDLRVLLDQACAEFDVQTFWISQPAIRSLLVDLIMKADREQMALPAFRKELSQWMHAKKSKVGIPTDLLGQHGLAAYVAPLIVRTFDVGATQAAADSKLTEGSPDIVVLSSSTDTPAAWIQTGRALAHLTLMAMAAGRYSAYMNQPCELPRSRQQLADLIQSDGFPQLIIRLGLASPVRRAPRMPVGDVLANGSGCQ